MHQKAAFHPRLRCYVNLVVFKRVGFYNDVRVLEGWYENETGGFLPGHYVFTGGMNASPTVVRRFDDHIGRLSVGASHAGGNLAPRIYEGERWERCRWQRKRPERVAAVGR